MMISVLNVTVCWTPSKTNTPNTLMSMICTEDASHLLVQATVNQIMKCILS